jgi:hypothetical protein
MMRRRVSVPRLRLLRSSELQLLVAAHIKKRAECNLAEMNDFRNIVAAMCKLGCNELYERSYVSVDDQGLVTAHPGAPSTPDLAPAVAVLRGKRCTAWNAGTQRYFDQHHAKALAQFG